MFEILALSGGVSPISCLIAECRALKLNSDVPNLKYHIALHSDLVKFCFKRQEMLPRCRG